MKFLFIGDVVGKGGRNAVKALVPELRKEYNLSLVIANAENSAAGNGQTASTLADMAPVVDFFTAGDHVWDQKGFDGEIRHLDNFVRPANLAHCQPGRGYAVFRNPAGGDFAVIALQGKVFMRDSAYCPFETADRILKELPPTVKSVFVDFHAEATSEKIAMGYFLDGRVTAVVGTHTHVQTNDATVLPGGTAYLTDVGMAGGDRSVLGREVEAVVQKFTTGMPVRFPVVEKGRIRLDACVVTYDYHTGKAEAIEPIHRWVNVD